MRPLTLLWRLVATVLLLPGSLPAAAPKIIFDTDMTGDVDDVLALAMCHTLADRQSCELLAVTISKVNPLTGPFTDAVNTFYGRPDLPIGIARQAQERSSTYLTLVEKKAGSTLRFPHDLRSNESAPEAVPLIRRILAGQPDGSVSLVQVGLAVNMAGLLESKGDAYSDLAGADLIRRKVRLLSVMAGSFQTINHSNRYRESNVVNDVPAMQKLARQWPDEVPVIWSGFEIGLAAIYQRESIARDFEYVPHHPVKEAYLLHSGPNHDRPTWDLSSVLYAVHPNRGYFDLSSPGRVTIADDGFTQFTPAKDGPGRDRYLVMSPTQAARLREAFVQLVSQPPSANSPSSADRK